ncbi:CidA/LrgA family protein [Nocardioides sp. CBS4Y-1]|uniref:CidA/LrgA family protein n=1 Tax=Nocardioides acrostichi TaxID=2784339 RepID=A0A930Y6L4_9ACTN|nr:CidA/LrgA family protein [Nocardioides acrostichi]
MVTGLLWLLGCQLVGEVVVHALHAPIPGPVVGMVVLLVVLTVRGRRARPSARAGRDEWSVHVAADVLLPHLQLLFVPAGVGLIGYGTVLRSDGLAIVVALVGSWLLALAAVGWTAQLLARRSAAAERGVDGSGA